MKTCPFCQSNNLCVEEDVISMRDAKFKFYVTCQDCKAKGPAVYNRSLAIDFWDKRDGESEIQNLLLFAEDKKELKC